MKNDASAGNVELLATACLSRKIRGDMAVLYS